MTPDAICTELRRRGYDVQWKETTDDKLVIAIDFIKNRELPWIKAFALDKAAADPKAFINEIEGWKRDVRGGLACSMASPTVRAVIAHYGMPRTQKALEALSQ